MTRSTKWTKPGLAVLVVTSLLAVLAVAIATSAGAGEGGAPPAEIDSAESPTVTAVEPEQAEEIAELDRPARPDDELPARWERAIENNAEEGHSWGANPDLARHTAPGVWIMPGNGHVCLASSSPSDGSVGFGCASNEDVERGRLAPSDVDENGRGLLTGIVPDGVPSVEVVDLDGSTRTAAVDSNTYRVAIDANLKEVRFTDADGGQHVLPMEWKR